MIAVLLVAVIVACAVTCALVLTGWGRPERLPTSYRLDMEKWIEDWVADGKPDPIAEWEDSEDLLDLDEWKQRHHPARYPLSHVKVLEPDGKPTVPEPWRAEPGRTDHFDDDELGYTDTDEVGICLDCGGVGVRQTKSHYGWTDPIDCPTCEGTGLVEVHLTEDEQPSLFDT